jgi:hypothetical protein
MEGLAFAGSVMYSVFINLPKIVMLIISVVMCSKRKYAKSSKLFLLIGILILLISWIPTIIANYSLKVLISNYNFGYALYFLSLYSGIFLGSVLLIISLIVSFPYLANNARGVFITCVSILMGGFISAALGIGDRRLCFADYDCFLRAEE